MYETAAQDVPAGVSQQNLARKRAWANKKTAESGFFLFRREY
jgi:hypothetical protein